MLKESGEARQASRDMREAMTEVPKKSCKCQVAREVRSVSPA